MFPWKQAEEQSAKNSFASRDDRLEYKWNSQARKRELWRVCMKGIAAMPAWNGATCGCMENWHGMARCHCLCHPADIFAIQTSGISGKESEDGNAVMGYERDSDYD